MAGRCLPARLSTVRRSSGVPGPDRHQRREDGCPAARHAFKLMADRCLAVSGRGGRSRLPVLAPVLELHREQQGRRLDRSCVPPRTRGRTWSTVVA